MINMKIANKKKMKNALLVVIIIFLLLIIRIWYIQFLKGEFLMEKGSEQQRLSRSITAKRGTIYDSSKKYILAISANVETVTINPTQIAKQDKEKVAQALSDIFELDYEKVLKKVMKNKRQIQLQKMNKQIKNKIIVNNQTIKIIR